MYYLFYQGHGSLIFFFFFPAEDGIRDRNVTGVQTCALPISVAVTRPEGATSLAMESAGSPTPLARSRTRMPGRRWAASIMASVAPCVNVAIWACHLRQAATVLSPVHSWRRCSRNFWILA